MAFPALKCSVITRLLSQMLLRALNLKTHDFFIDYQLVSSFLVLLVCFELSTVSHFERIQNPCIFY